jgi:hypothetical protein
MTTTVRDELLATLDQLSAACPEMRFGQLIANLATLARGLNAESIWDAEDEELLTAAQKQLNYFETRQEAGPAFPAAPTSAAI